MNSSWCFYYFLDCIFFPFTQYNYIDKWKISPQGFLLIWVEGFTLLWLTLFSLSFACIIAMPLILPSGDPYSCLHLNHAWTSLTMAQFFFNFSTMRLLLWNQDWSVISLRILDTWGYHWCFLAYLMDYLYLNRFLNVLNQSMYLRIFNNKYRNFIWSLNILKSSRFQHRIYLLSTIPGLKPRC